MVDYRVRILDQGHGTDATVRVLIQTTDGRHVWTTVGVGHNIIEASWEALSDGYLYGLIHSADARPGADVDELSVDQSSAVPVGLRWAAARHRAHPPSAHPDHRSEPIGVGSGEANYATAQTNFVGVLNQAEAARLYRH